MPIHFRFLLILMFSSMLFVPPSCHAEPPRIAVLPVDTDQNVQTLADLLSARLSTDQTIEIVERSEIDRILTEQDMIAAGLTDVQ